MRVAGTRTDGALWLVLDGGMSVLLRGDQCSPPVDPLDIEPLGPWNQTSGITGSVRRTLTRQLDNARTVPLYTLGGAGSGNFGHAGRPGEVGGSASGDGGGGGVSAPKSAGLKMPFNSAYLVARPTQPLQAAKIAPAALAKAEALVLSETKTNKVPVDDVLDALGGNAREQYEELLAKGHESHPVMQALVDDIASRMGEGTIARNGPVKTMDRAVKKTVGKDSGDARNVRDVVRSSVAVDHVDDLQRAIDTVHEATEAAGMKVVEVDDRFTNPLASGYRDLNLNVRLPNGVVGEIQVHLSSMLAAKEDKGHALYEQSRVILERGNKRALTPDEVTEVERLNVAQRVLYGSAWRKGGGK